jgi:hypothetical protein
MSFMMLVLPNSIIYWDNINKDFHLKEENSKMHQTVKVAPERQL